MKKIININLSGRILPIEEPAYEQLQSYIGTLRNFFSSEQGRDEIINDIEGRFAELMYDKIKKGSDCITETDVHELISLMGRPEELAQEAPMDEEPSGTSSAQSGSENSSSTGHEKRQLCRDENNKIIGGVAGGLAAYLGIDPAIVRVLFVILAFSSFGLAAFAYVLMWIFIPAALMESYKGKRFYRNPDDKILGGVASGLAAYFDKPAKTIRLIFLAPLLLQILFWILDVSNDDFTIVVFNLSAGSLVGFSIILYITLWVILPKAITPYQKMEMRGEKIDLASIRKQVNQGAEQLKEKVKSWEKEVETVANELPGKAEKFASEVSERVQEKFSGNKPTLVSRLLYVVALLFKIFFAFVFGVIAFSLLAALLAVCFAGAVTWPYQGFIWGNTTQQLLAWASVIFFVLVPILAFIIWLIRRILGIKTKSAVLRYSFFSLWTLGWVMLFLFFTSMGKEFSKKEQSVTAVSISAAQPPVLMLTVSQPALSYSNSVPWIHADGDDMGGWDLTQDSLKLSNVVIETALSPDSSYHVKVIRTAFGRSADQALLRAESLLYPVREYTDTTKRSATASSVSVIDLPSGYAIAAKDKFRAQQVKVVVQVPAGKNILFDRSIKEKLNGSELQIRYNKRGRVSEFLWEDVTFPYRGGVEYKMMPDGTLRRADGVEEDPVYNKESDEEVPSLPSATPAQLRTQRLHHVLPLPSFLFLFLG